MRQLEIEREAIRRENDEERVAALTKEIEELRWVTPAQLTEELRTTPERFASWFLTAAPMVLRFLE